MWPSGTASNAQDLYLRWIRTISGDVFGGGIGILKQPPFDWAKMLETGVITRNIGFAPHYGENMSHTPLRQGPPPLTFERHPRCVISPHHSAFLTIGSPPTLVSTRRLYRPTTPSSSGCRTGVRRPRVVRSSVPGLWAPVFSQSQKPGFIGTISRMMCIGAMVH